MTTDIDNLRTILDAFGEEAAPDFIAELKDCAWNIIRENPGIDRSAWGSTLIRQYPAEVVDAIGADPTEAHRRLTDLWETEYTDPDTGTCNTFAAWSKYFATDPEALPVNHNRSDEPIQNQRQKQQN